MIIFSKNILMSYKQEDIDKEDLSLWEYTNLSNGKKLLTKYIGSDFDNTIYVPTNNTVINDSGRCFDYDVKYVDLQYVPFVNNNMCRALSECEELKEVYNINENVTNMSDCFAYCYSLNYNIQIPNSVTDMRYCFEDCYNLNQNIQIPNSVTSMDSCFQGCYNLNQNIQIPNSVTGMWQTFQECTNLNQNIQIPNSITDMYNTFSYCDSLNQNIQIPNSVKVMYNTFSYCDSLNQNIQIPNSVTDMSGTFDHCTNLNQNIQIPNSVTDMSETFQNCTNLSGRINVLTTNLYGDGSRNTFYNTTLPKEVYIYYQYANGMNTSTYNLAVLGNHFGGSTVNTQLKWDGQNGVTVYNLGKAPW